MALVGGLLTDWRWSLSSSGL